MTDAPIFGRRLGWGERPAVLVVDLVRAYTDPEGPLYVGDRSAAVVGAVDRLVAVAQARDVPVVWTTVRYRPDGRDGGVFFRKAPVLSCFVGDSPHGRLAAGLRPGADDLLVEKRFPSAFAGTPLAAHLTAAGVDTIVIAGVSTSGCVRASATDAMSNGFVPLVVRQAVADRDPAAHAANLHDIDAKVGDVIDLDEALAGLAR